MSSRNCRPSCFDRECVIHVLHRCNKELGASTSGLMGSSYRYTYRPATMSLGEGVFRSCRQCCFSREFVTQVLHRCNKELCDLTAKATVIRSSYRSTHRPVHISCVDGVCRNCKPFVLTENVELMFFTNATKNLVLRHQL